MNQDHQSLALHPGRVRDDRQFSFPGQADGPSLFDGCVATVCPETGIAGFALAWGADRRDGAALCLRPVLRSVQAGPAQLLQDEIWLWCGQPGTNRGEQAWPDLLPLLSPEERDRTARFKFAADAWSYAAAHAGLRLLLARLLGCDADEVRFAASAKGKPALDPAVHGSQTSARIQFNLAHTRGMVAIVLATCPVGIDVEACRPMSDMRDLVVDLMSDEALEAFDAAVDTQTRMEVFFRNWTLSEAFIKTTGEGLDQGLSTFAFTQCGHAKLVRTTRGWGPTDRWVLGVKSGSAGGRAQAAA